MVPGAGCRLCVDVENGVGDVCLGYFFGDDALIGVSMLGRRCVLSPYTASRWLIAPQLILGVSI